MSESNHVLLVIAADGTYSVFGPLSDRSARRHQLLIEKKQEGHEVHDLILESASDLREFVARI